METRAALIMERRGHEIRIAPVDGRAARQWQMRKRWSTIILQRTKERIGVDLIARSVQMTATIVAADVVTL